MEKLKIAIQKSGRLNECSMRLLKECGLHLSNEEGQLVARASNFPLEVLYLRNADVPRCVENGVADVAIVGENTVVEHGGGVEILLNLNFSACRLSLAVPKEVEFPGLDWLAGKRIATSYPNTLQDFLSQNGIVADIQVISGSVEIAPNIGLADAICDIVSSGSTLLKNGLKEVYVLFHSAAVLVATPGLPEGKRGLLQELMFRMRAVLAAQDYKYILLNVPREKLQAVCDLLPGMRSPTIMPLREDGWYSLHSVVEERVFWESIGALKENGAEGILAIPIEKMVQ